MLRGRKCAKQNQPKSMAASPEMRSKPRQNKAREAGMQHLPTPGTYTSPQHHGPVLHLITHEPRPIACFRQARAAASNLGSQPEVKQGRLMMVL
jgi:hypothetical protein